MNLTVDQSSPENLEIIKKKISNAKETVVEEKYILVAQEISKKIELNLTAKDSLKSLVEYPVRDFPPEPQIDPKTKKRINFFTINP